MSAIRTFWLICLVLGTQFTARARCNPPPPLSASVAEFHTRQASRIEALIIFGEQHDLCFGIEQVDTALLTKLSDFDIESTSLVGAIRSILGSDHPATIEEHFGVIEIIPIPRKPKNENVFDLVMPRWQAQRGNLQLVSWLLHIQLVQDLNPQIQGFGGSTGVGNTEYEIGPFNERRLPVRYLLDKIVAQSRGAVWIAQIPWNELGNFNLLENHRAWAILEYGGPRSNYSALLNGVAAGLLRPETSNKPPISPR